jgi:hypothetical protein
MDSRHIVREDIWILPGSCPVQRPSIVPKSQCSSTKGPDLKIKDFSEFPYVVWELPILIAVRGTNMFNGFGKLQVKKHT